MRKIKVILCFAISLVMILTMTGMTASAMEGVDGVGDPIPQENETEYDIDEQNGFAMDQEAPPEEEGDMAMEAQSEPSYAIQAVPNSTTRTQSDTPKATKTAYPGPKVNPVSKVKVIPGYYKVKIKWAKKKGYVNKPFSYKGKDGTVTEKFAYKIYRSGQYRKTVKKPTWTHYINVKMYKVYTYKIVAVKTAYFTSDDGTMTNQKIGQKSASKTVKGQCVRKMRIKITPRSTRSLTSRDGKGKHIRIRPGTKVWSDRYGGGNYYFKKNGATFRLMRENARPIKADYKTKGKNYSWETANYFINSYVKKNKVAQKKYLLWVSSYHQRMYAFKKVGNNKWKCVNSWDVSMGKKSTPSPTGKKKIWKRMRSHHGISYWSCYSSYNCLHGVSSSMKENLGRIASHGCIRNTNKGAKWIWDHCPKGTTVLVY